MSSSDWSEGVHRAFARTGIGLVAHVPDAGLTPLLARCTADPAIRVVGLCDEREGPALLAGAWLGGLRGLLACQSSGIGNLVNMLGVSAVGRFPLAMLVTMRGEWGEQNPWQVPMGQAVPAVLGAMGVRLFSLERAEDAEAVLDGALGLAFGSEQMVAVLIRQRLLGAKRFVPAGATAS
ncbi:MAG: phosphonopyruvate decarboxylase [Geminicoccaceae bacterium]|nr:phosphonopyruvate decarboxylase [Geminicoccaceae bacterium]